MPTTIIYLLLFSGMLGKSASTDYQHINDLQLHITNASMSGVATVEIKNASSKPLRVWDESNSWGAARWRIFLVRLGKTKSFFENPNQDFVRNNPIFDEVPSGNQKAYRLDLNGGNWCGVGRCTSFGSRRHGSEQVRFQRGDMIIISYDVPYTPESLRFDVWYGVATAFQVIR